MRERGRSVPLNGCVRIGGTGQLDLGRSAQAAPAVGPTVAALKRVPQQQARRLVARSAGAQRSSFAVQCGRPTRGGTPAARVWGRPPRCGRAFGSSFEAPGRGACHLERFRFRIARGSHCRVQGFAEETRSPLIVRVEGVGAAAAAAAASARSSNSPSSLSLIVGFIPHRPSRPLYESSLVQPVQSQPHRPARPSSDPASPAATT